MNIFKIQVVSMQLLAVKIAGSFAIGLFALAGCGGGGSVDTPSVLTPPTNAANSARVIFTNVVAEPSGKNCANGGIKVELGLDSNGNGRLDLAEVSRESFNCDEDVTDLCLVSDSYQTGEIPCNHWFKPFRPLVRPVYLVAATPTIAIYTGVDCPKRPLVADDLEVLTGLDVDLSKSLQIGERRRSDLGLQRSGANQCIDADFVSKNPASLVSVEVEKIGLNCALGGSKVVSAVDLDADGVIDEDEITSTAYLCKSQPAASFKWVDTSNAALQTKPNEGYYANGATETTFALPLAPKVGDIVRIAGKGAGGWKIKQNAGQSILTALPVSASARHVTAGVENWTDIAASDAFETIVAIARDGNIFTSTDVGDTWIARESKRKWISVAISPDGKKLVAAEEGGQIYTSTDAGVNWSPGADNRAWRKVVSSNGNTLLALDSANGLHISRDSGLTWQQQDPSKEWDDASLSADGNSIIASSRHHYPLDRYRLPGTAIHLSKDAGLNWTISFAGGTNMKGVSAQISADGKSALALTFVPYREDYARRISGFTGTLFSLDGGVNWNNPIFDYTLPPLEAASRIEQYNQQYPLLLPLITKENTIVGSTQEIPLLVNNLPTGRLETAFFTSNDFGFSYQQSRTISDKRTKQIISKKKMIVVEYGGNIFTSWTGQTTPGSLGSLSGAQHDAIELQYLGDGVFKPLSFLSYSTGFKAR
jgi:hypothetical protein